MKRIYKSITKTLLSLYIVFVCGNVASHGYEAWRTQRESQKAIYGDNLRQQWENHSSSCLERLTNTRIFIPLSSWDSPDKPYLIKVVGDSGSFKWDLCEE